MLKDKAIAKNMIQKTKRSIQWVIRKTAGNNLKYAGVHLVADFWNGKPIEDAQNLREILIKAAQEAGATPLEVSIHKFSPQGITGVVLLAESHIAVHSWPEYNYMAIDIFTCGDKSVPRKALEYLEERFQPQKMDKKEIKRGRI